MATALLAAALGACSPRLAVRGNLPDPEQVVEVLPGESDREDVQRILGSPSTLSTFQDSTWYYIGERTEQTAFFKPDVVERSVLTITFNDAGLVDDTAMVDRQTPTEGNELTIWQQLIGNIGRFTGNEPRQRRQGL